MNLLTDPSSAACQVDVGGGVRLPKREHQAGCRHAGVSPKLSTDTEDSGGRFHSLKTAFTDFGI